MLITDAELRDLVKYPCLGYLVMSFSVSGRGLGKNSHAKISSVLARHRFVRLIRGFYVIPLRSLEQKERIKADLRSIELPTQASIVFFEQTQSQMAEKFQVMEVGGEC